MTNKVDWFKDFVCLISEMFNTLDNHPLFDLINDKMWQTKENWQDIICNMVSDATSDNARKNKIYNLISIMFDGWKSLYQKYCVANKAVINETFEKFIVNRLLRAVMLHNYYHNSVSNDSKQNKKQLVFTMKLANEFDSDDIDATDSKCQEIADNSLRQQFLNEMWKKVDRKAMCLMCNENDDIENFKLMRLLVVTCNFMVECQGTLQTDIKCVNYDHQQSDEKRLICELKQNMLDENYDQIQPVVDLLYSRARNNNGKLLNRLEISCIRMLSSTQVNDRIKPCHRRGETCKWRYFSSHVISGLRKLKNLDKIGENKLKQVRSVYTGISNVSFNVSERKSSIKQFLNQFCSGGLSQKNNSDKTRFSTNKIDYCLSWDTFTSVSDNAQVALSFGKSLFNQREGIVFDIDVPLMYQNENIIYGDISWISEYPNEREILVAPCMIYIFKMRKDKWPKCCQKENKIEVFGAELRQLGNVSMLIKQVKSKIMAQNHGYHDTNKEKSTDKDLGKMTVDYNSLNKDEKEIYDCMCKSVSHNCGYYFKQLKKQRCTNKVILKMLTEDHLEFKLGVAALGDRLALLSAFQQL